MIRDEYREQGLAGKVRNNPARRSNYPSELLFPDKRALHSTVVTDC